MLIGISREFYLNLVKLEFQVSTNGLKIHVSENPDKTALVADDCTLTYKQLDEKANCIANALIEKGVDAKSNILIKLSRNSNLIASILLGILKAGCAFIPVDPEYPQGKGKTTFMKTARQKRLHHLK